MNDNRLRKIFRSLFFKLLVVILLTGIIINLLVFGFFRYAVHSSPDSHWVKYIRRYVEYIVEDLGNPPDRRRAEELDRDSGIATEWIGPHIAWQTQNARPLAKRGHDLVLYQDGQTRIIFHRGHHQIAVDRTQGRFIFTFARPFAGSRQAYFQFGVLIGLLTLVLVAAYIVLRKLLHPIKLLRSGAERIGKGQLNLRIDAKASNELGDLAKQFNTMAGRFKEMLSAREQLLLDVSHELRTPLTRTKVALELLPESKARQNISDDVAEMEAMVAKILETARMRNGSQRIERRQVDIAGILHRVLKPYRDQFPGIRYEKPPSPVYVMADPQRIRTVMDNVLTNAVKYSHSGSAPIGVALKERADEVVVSVADNGIGMPADELARIFEPFYRIEKSRSKSTGGYGLGLSLCKSIMEAHGGKIEVVSEVEQGTTVRLAFPTTSEETTR